MFRQRSSYVYTTNRNRMHAARILNWARLEHNYYFCAEFLEEIQYIPVLAWSLNGCILVTSTRTSSTPHTKCSIQFFQDKHTGRVWETAYIILCLRAKILVHQSDCRTCHIIWTITYFSKANLIVEKVFSSLKGQNECWLAGFWHCVGKPQCMISHTSFIITIQNDHHHQSVKEF